MRSAEGLVVLGLCLTGLLVSECGADVIRAKRDDVAQHSIDVTTIEEEPWVYKNGDQYTGFIPDLMEKLKDKVRFTYQFKLAPDKKYGQKMANGRWNGMIGQIEKEEADMAAAPLTISDERKEVVEFTEPFMSFDYTVLIKKPAGGKKLSIKTVRDLADQTKIKYGLVKDGRTERIFEEAKDDAKLKKMWGAISKNDDYRLSSLEDGVEKVRESNGTFAFIMEQVSADYWVKKEPCDLTTTGKDANVKGSSYAFALKKTFEKKKEFDDAIKELKKEGEIEKLKKEWWKGDCKGSSAASATSSLLLMSAVASLALWRQL